jgi:hypothetical protein
MDFGGAARHGRRVLEQFPRPQGRVNSREDREKVQHAFYSIVKYVARHVSERLPEGFIRPDTCPNRSALQDALRGMDLTIVPIPFRQMIVVLNVNQTMQLTDDMYEAAFATEILGRMTFGTRMSDPDFAAGYNVQRQL